MSDQIQWTKEKSNVLNSACVHKHARVTIHDYVGLPSKLVCIDFRHGPRVMSHCFNTQLDLEDAKRFAQVEYEKALRAWFLFAGDE